MLLVLSSGFGFSGSNYNYDNTNTVLSTTGKPSFDSAQDDKQPEPSNQ